jgi:hypothetical protein
VGNWGLVVHMCRVSSLIFGHSGSQEGHGVSMMGSCVQSHHIQSGVKIMSRTSVRIKVNTPCIASICGCRSGMQGSNEFDYPESQCLPCLRQVLLTLALEQNGKKRRVQGIQKWEICLPDYLPAPSRADAEFQETSSYYSKGL